MTGRPFTWDAVVVGGGPAGAIAAMRLAPKHRVLVLERAAAPAPRIGESLPPACRPLLRDLGLLERMDVHRPYLGNRSLWGGGPATHDFLRDPQGPGWHLDRAAFDDMLMAAATEAGTTLWRCVTLRAATRLAGGWGLVTSHGHRIRCRVLVDASGRSAALCRRLGAQRQVLDRLTAVYCRFRPGSATSTDGFSRIEAAADGWWYTAPLPAGGRVAAYHTDSDRPAIRDLGKASGFLSALAQTRMIAPELGLERARIADGPHVVPAHSARSVPPTGDGWVAVGDAALALDPLSSQGLFNALFTGMAGGDAAAAILANDGKAGHAYANRIAEIHAAYTSNLADFYGAEAVLHEGAFWARRMPAPRQAMAGA
ncbi:MAG: tryptophan 7-halogenase [Alphaproteobacteria bacterium]|nr:tryptophan 7-halogenase [Alphaproteobacteria bacterium]